MLTGVRKYSNKKALDQVLGKEAIAPVDEGTQEHEFHLHQGASEHLAEMAQLDRIDFAIATGSHDLFRKCVLLPCYQWHRRIIVPADHPLARVKQPQLEGLAAYPLVTYVFSFTGPSSLQETFAAAAKHFNPEQLMHIVLTLGQYMMTCRIVETFDVDLQPLNAEA